MRSSSSDQIELSGSYKVEENWLVRASEDFVGDGEPPPFLGEPLREDLVVVDSRDSLCRCVAADCGLRSGLFSFLKLSYRAKLLFANC